MVHDSDSGVQTDRVLLCHAPLDVALASKLATAPTTGATSLFVGTTRDSFEGKEVVRLEYEAYNSMAIKEMLKLCVDARARWSLCNIIIMHRLGVVAVEEASVIIAVSSPHRRESLEALHHLIDTLKASVPIFKKEMYADDSGEWKANKESGKK